MIISKKTYSVIQGNEDVLLRSVLESEECLSNSDESRYVQIEMFRQLFQVPELTMCETMPFEKMTMIHDGIKWIINLTAIKKKKETQSLI